MLKAWAWSILQPFEGIFEIFFPFHLNTIYRKTILNFWYFSLHIEINISLPFNRYKQTYIHLIASSIWQFLPNIFLFSLFLHLACDIGLCVCMRFRRRLWSSGGKVILWANPCHSQASNQYLHKLEEMWVAKNNNDTHSTLHLHATAHSLVQHHSPSLVAKASLP